MINPKTPPIVVPVYTDNGEHSHFKLLDVRTGKTLWEEEEDVNMMFTSGTGGTA